MNQLSEYNDPKIYSKFYTKKKKIKLDLLGLKISLNGDVLAVFIFV